MPKYFTDSFALIGLPLTDISTFLLLRTADFMHLPEGGLKTINWDLFELILIPQSL
jgi:hypothetical protein